MRIIGIILSIPAIAALKVAGSLLTIFVRLSTFLVGPFLVFMAGCGVYCVVTQDWKNLMIFAVFAGAVVVVYLLAGLVLGMVDIVGKRIGRFIRP